VTWISVVIVLVVTFAQTFECLLYRTPHSNTRYIVYI